jgi:DNA repair photolyase
LNKVWGEDLKPLDLSILKRKLENGLKNKNPKSFIAHALKQKKTLRFGNKADPYQEAEKEYYVTKGALRLLIRYDWSFVLQTRFTKLMIDRDLSLLRRANCIVMPVISTGFMRDWEIFERQRTTSPERRLVHLEYLRGEGIHVGINGEPFIPGFHSVREFAEMMKRLSARGFRSYNTYSFHWNEFVAKRLVDIGVDIEKIWHYNRDEKWKPILIKLIGIAKKYNIDLGCPDFVNSGGFVQKANTCCGIDVPNPCEFNAITWKRLLKEGMTREEVLTDTFDGVGDWGLGEKVMFGKTKEFYTMDDIDESN